MRISAFFVSLEWCDLFRVASGAAAPEEVFFVIEIPGAPSGAARMDRLVDHHLRKEGDVAARSRWVKSGVVSAEKARSEGRSVDLAIAHAWLAHRAEVGIRTLSWLQIVTDIAARAALPDGDLTLLSEVGHVRI
jgi:hypothetical protein